LIEDAALRNEPEAKRQRRAEREPQTEAALFILAERRRKRYPVLAHNAPPLGEPVAIFHFGVVVFEATDVDSLEGVAAIEALGTYPHVHDGTEPYVWAHWRLPSVEEIYYTRPGKDPTAWDLKVRAGWWPPDREERNERLRKLREIERAKRTRHEKGHPSADAAE